MQINSFTNQQKIRLPIKNMFYQTYASLIICNFCYIFGFKKHSKSQFGYLEIHIAKKQYHRIPKLAEKKF